MRRKNSHAESIMEESYEGNRKLYVGLMTWDVWSFRKKIRRTLRIREGDPLEIFTDREGEIILKKYSPIGELAAFAGMYADSLAKRQGALCVSVIWIRSWQLPETGEKRCRKSISAKFFKGNWKKETVFWQR